MLRFGLTQSYTVSAWVKAQVLAGGWRGLVTKSRNLSPWYGIWIDNTSHWVGGGSNLTGPTLTAGWHHAVLVQDGVNNTRVLYLDGASVVTGTAIAADGAGPLWIGGAVNVSEYFNGWIDDVRIYNRALAASEINDLATAPLPVPKPTLTAVRNVNNLRITWPTNATGFVLETSPVLPSAGWQAVSQSPRQAQIFMTPCIAGRSRIKVLLEPRRDDRSGPDSEKHRQTYLARAPGATTFGKWTIYPDNH